MQLVKSTKLIFLKFPFFNFTKIEGGAIEGMRPGQGVIIEDHVNFLKRNPLQGWLFGKTYNFTWNLKIIFLTKKKRINSPRGIIQIHSRCYLQYQNKANCSRYHQRNSICSSRRYEFEFIYDFLLSFLIFILQSGMMNH